MKTVRRFLSLFLAAILAVTFNLPGVAPKAYAAGETVETKDIGEIKARLESDEDVTVKLSGNVSYKMEDASLLWCMVGSGKKILDLNGHTLEIKQEENLKGETFYMIEVPSGASLTVNDSSGKNAGKLVANGYIHKWVSGPAGSHESDYKERDVLYRNVIHVTGGDFVLNYGTIKAGRKKDQYIGYGYNVEEYVVQMNNGSTWGSKNPPRYDGYVDKVINSAGITVTDGTVTINGGVVEGRGFRKIRFFKSGGMNLITETNAAIIADGGKVVINNGSFDSMSCADSLKVSDEAEVIIRSGNFYTHKNDKILFPDDGGWTSVEPLYYEGFYGSVPDTAYIESPSMVMIEEDDHSLLVDPLDDAELLLYNEYDDQEIGEKLLWDGKSDVVLYANLSPYWPWEEIPYNKTDNSKPYHYFGALAQSSKEMGVTSSISIGGMTVSEGGEATAIEKRVSTSAMLAPDCSKISFHLKDLLPDGLSMGDSFLVTVRWSDILYNSEKDPSGMMTSRKAFTVQLQENDITIVQQPAGKSVKTTGEKVVLSAQAENATNAWWEQVYPGSASGFTGESFDPDTGIAQLTVPVDGLAKYVCHFANSMGAVKTNEATVSLLVTPTVAEADTKDVTWYTASPYAYLNAGLLSPAGRQEQRWYYRADPADEWTQLEKEDGKWNPVFYPGALFVKSPVKEYEGYYRMEADYKTDTGVETLKSGVFHVTVVEGAPVDIHEVTIHGLEDLYVGDKAPSAEDLYAEESGVEIIGVKWTGMTSPEGVINSSAGMVEITLRAVGGKFINTSTEEFKVHLTDTRLTTKNLMPGQTETTVSYTFTPTNGLPVPQETVSVTSGTSYEFPPGVILDIPVEYEVNESARPQPCGISEVTNLKMDESASGKWPEGLYLEKDADGIWHIKGKVSPDAAPGSMTSVIHFTLQNSVEGEKNYAVPFRILITPVISTKSLPADLSAIFHTHTYSVWQDTGDGETHIRVCGGCDNEEVQPHSWGDGVVTKEATGTAPGVITYTCQVCGAVKTEETEVRSIIQTEVLEPTVAEEGVLAHYECAETGQPFEDAAGTIPLANLSALSIPKVTYTVAKGANGAYESSAKAGPYEITVNRSWKDETTFAHFKALLMDGQEIAPSNYTAKAGSLNASLNAAYLATLAEGEHILTVRFDDADVTAKITITIAKEAEAPRTGTDLHIGLYLALMGLALAGMGGMLYVPRRKKK